MILSINLFSCPFTKFVKSDSLLNQSTWNRADDDVHARPYWKAGTQLQEKIQLSGVTKTSSNSFSAADIVREGRCYQTQNCLPENAHDWIGSEEETCYPAKDGRCDGEKFREIIHLIELSEDGESNDIVLPEEDTAESANEEILVRSHKTICNNTIRPRTRLLILSWFRTWPWTKRDVWGGNSAQKKQSSDAIIPRNQCLQSHRSFFS